MVDLSGEVGDIVHTSPQDLISRLIEDFLQHRSRLQQSLDQARVLALQHARDNRDVYGSYADRELVWEVVGADETEDYYEVKLSYRPSRGFRGRPGVEQFTIDKTGPIEFRQKSSLSPSHHRGVSPTYSCLPSFWRPQEPQ